MTFRDRMSVLANRMRRYPVSLDERPTTVTVRTRTWTGGRKGREGGTTDVDLLLSPTPKVREVSQRNITSSAGRYELGDVRVGPITPAHTGGGYTKAQLAPDDHPTGVETFYVLAGDTDGEYALVDLSTDRTHSWFLVLRRRRTTP